MTGAEGVAVYATALAIGMLHGVEPGHGWPVAAVFAMRHRWRWWYGIWAAVILASAHLVSSFAVVALYAVANRFLHFEGVSWLNKPAGALLLLMAVHQWRAGHGHAEHHHHHHGHSPDGRGHGYAPVADPEGEAVTVPPGKRDLAKSGLLGLVGFAFMLGFVHEEEFAIIALSAGKASAWAVMAVYASAVALSLVALTSLAIATLNRFESRFLQHQRKLPRVSAAILGVMGVAYILGVL